MLEASAGVTNVTIQNLMFDGNRYDAPGLNCLVPKEVNDPASFYDLELSRAGALSKFTVEWVQFINAPANAVRLGGEFSSISHSYFGCGYASLTPQQTATRITAIFLTGKHNAALFNTIHHAGTAAINVYSSSRDAFVYGNSLFMNRYEISDGVQGGQLYLDNESQDAIVAGNVINGGEWPQPGSTVPTGCPAPPQAFNAGVEAYGSGHYFLNNEVVAHTGSGMQLAGTNPTERITISSAPYLLEDTVQRWIEDNKSGGIAFLGQGWCDDQTPPVQPCRKAAGVTLDAVFVGMNALGSVSLQDVSNAVDQTGVPIENPRIMNKESAPQVNAAYTGFFNGACLIGNENRAGQLDDTPEFGQLLSRPLPISMTSYIPSISPVTCPAPLTPAAPDPAPSRPGWPW